MEVSINSIQINLLDDKRLNYYHEYFRSNFNSDFQTGYGTELILDIINSLNDVENWIDIGGGTSTLFWSIPLKKVNQIYCNDLYAEAYYVLNEEVLKQNNFPKCYLDICEIYQINRKKLMSYKSKINKVYIFDALSEWNIDKKTFDLITQFGTFGLSPNAEAYLKSIQYSYSNLETKGHFIGANWLFNKEYAQIRGIDNSYLNERLISAFALENNCRILRNQFYPIKDINYSGVLIWHIIKN